MTLLPLPSTSDSTVVAHYGELVLKLGRQLVARLPSSKSFDDLVQAGRIALVDAARKYEPAGATFETYATKCIRGAMIDEIRKSDWTPRSVHRQARAAAEARRRIEQRRGRPAGTAEVARELGVSVADYHHLVEDSARATVLSLEAQELHSSVARVHSPERDDPARQVEQGAFRIALSQAIRELPPREMQVVKLHYGNGLKLEEIGDLLSITASRVCQIRSNAVRRLRVRLAGWDQGRDGPARGVHQPDDAS